MKIKAQKILNIFCVLAHIYIYIYIIAVRTNIPIFKEKLDMYTIFFASTIFSRIYHYTVSRGRRHTKNLDA